jgi:uracil-DNA glycosylase
MQETINLPEKIEGIKNKLVGSGWEPILYPYIESEKFYSTLNKLVDFVQEDRRFTPKMSDWFNAFIQCKYENLNVIFIGQDPYPQIGVADGISFSCSKTMTTQPSLRHIFNALEKHYPGYNKDCDLSRWSNQGVLMLNTALTVEINKIGSHYSLWHYFTTHLLTQLNRHDSQLVVVLLGKKAQEWKKLITNHIIFEVEHPAAAAYKGGIWDDKNVFNNVNNILQNQGKTSIKW